MIIAHRSQRRPPDPINFLIAEAVPDETLTTLMVNPKRPGRFEPRVRTRRRNGYRVMTRPRSELKAMIARGEEIKCR